MGDADQPHNKLKEYALDALADDVDLVEEGGKMARNIFVVTAGTGIIKVVCGDGSVAALTGLADGAYIEPSPSWFTKIIDDASTDITLVRIGW